MSPRIPPPKYAIDFVAGLIGLLFDRIDGTASPAAEEVPDDLTKISGIGPTFARRLNEAGINTYAELAGLTPERIQEVTHVAQWQADPNDWIAEAKSLA